MSKPERPRSEVLDQLARRRSALESSCTGFDRGDDWEVERIATEVFTLVHDGGSIVSVLSQLGLRSSARFVSTTRRIDKKNLLEDTPLVLMRLATDGARYLPRLGEGPTLPYPVQFKTWWEKELIFRHNNFELTRRRLVFALRHQDGGGHVGRLTDSSYVHFKTTAFWHSVGGSGSPKPIVGALAQQ